MEVPETRYTFLNCQNGTSCKRVPFIHNEITPIPRYLHFESGKTVSAIVDGVSHKNK
jgi:hypothetical protein